MEIIFDLILLAVVIGGAYYGYKHGNLNKIYEIVKLIVAVAVSSKYGLSLSMWLTKLNIIKAETFGVLILIGFVMMFVLYLVAMFVLELAYKEFLESYLRHQSKYVASIFSSIEFFVMFTLALFILLQFYLPRVYLKPVLFKSFTYKHIHYFYRGFLSNELINNTLYEGSGAGVKETIMHTAAEHL